MYAGKFTFSICLFVLTATSIARGDGKCYDPLVNECSEASQKARADAQKMGTAAINDSEQMNGNAANLGASELAAVKLFQGAVQLCEDKKKLCEDKCKKSPADVQACTKKINEIKDNTMTESTIHSEQGEALRGRADLTKSDNPKDQQTNAAGTTAGEKTAAKEEKGGGMNMGSLIGPAAMAGVAAMGMMNKQEEEDEKNAIAEHDAMYAVQSNGSVRCDKVDSGLYRDCNVYLEAACTQSLQNRIFGQSQTCTNFATRYCTGGDGQIDPPASIQNAAASAAMMTGPQLGFPGGGRNSAFCANANAYTFCSSGASADCPSCQRLANLTSLACQTNPASCMAQSSNASIANSSAACQDDPLVKASQQAVANAAPVVAGSIPGDAASAITAPSAISGVQPARANGRGVASAGPKSDIGGEYGPTVSTLTQQAFAKLCQKDSLNNCP